MLEEVCPELVPGKFGSQLARADETATNNLHTA
jgi:hypothetical protein